MRADTSTTVISEGCWRFRRGLLSPEKSERPYSAASNLVVALATTAAVLVRPRYRRAGTKRVHDPPIAAAPGRRRLLCHRECMGVVARQSYRWCHRP